MSELNNFRLINKIEGYSYLILVLIAMPLKHLMHYPMPTKIAGMAHGVLFVAFVYLLIIAFRKVPFAFRESLKYFILSLIPFGSFYTEKVLKNKYNLV